MHNRRPAKRPPTDRACVRCNAPILSLSISCRARAVCMLGGVAAQRLPPIRTRFCVSRVFDIETLDPQRISDDPSSQVAAAIFEGLYDWSYLGSPAHSSPCRQRRCRRSPTSGRTWTMHLQPGIRFTDDPAFGGKPRELVAEDIVFSMKRALDPTLKRGGNAAVTEVVVGARAVIDATEKSGTFRLRPPHRGHCAP